MGFNWYVLNRCFPNFFLPRVVHIAGGDEGNQRGEGIQGLVGPEDGSSMVNHIQSFSFGMGDTIQDIHSSKSPPLIE